MPQITDLKDLLKHEILDLYSAEEQIIDALPKMVDKSTNASLKKALRDHLKVTELQKNRLDEIKEIMGESEGSDKKGFFSKLFAGSGGEKCKGTEGLIKEGEKMMGEDMSPEVMDAAIIGAAQKIEHYEISGYGTAVAYARELSLSNVAGLLQQTLDEEYAADDSLTKLAVGKLNAEAENTSPAKNISSAKSGQSKNSNPSKSTNSGKSSGSKAPTRRVSPSKSASKSSTSPGKISAAKSVSKPASKSGGKSSGTRSKKHGKSESSKKR